MIRTKRHTGIKRSNAFIASVGSASGSASCSASDSASGSADGFRPDSRNTEYLEELTDLTKSKVDDDDVRQSTEYTALLNYTVTLQRQLETMRDDERKNGKLDQMFDDSTSGCIDESSEILRRMCVNVTSQYFDLFYRYLELSSGMTTATVSDANEEQKEEEKKKPKKKRVTKTDVYIANLKREVQYLWVVSNFFQGSYGALPTELRKLMPSIDDMSEME